MMKIVVDAFGGDNAPNEVVKGVVEAIASNDKLHIVLTGKEDILKYMKIACPAICLWNMEMYHCVQKVGVTKKQEELRDVNTATV